MYLWTSEAVSAGHPDKLADQVADALLDAYLAVDPLARVAVEVTCCRDLVLLTGEVSPSLGNGFRVDHEAIARAVFARVGYNASSGWDGASVPILDHIAPQSREIAEAVTHDDGTIGAGDQGMMFGFACRETPSFMPLAHQLAFDFINRLTVCGRDLGFFPDAKTQVTLRCWPDGDVQRVDNVVISTQHDVNLIFDRLRERVMREVVNPVVGQDQNTPSIFTPKTVWRINPAGAWHVGGPAADTGLSGRKIVVDNYGSDCPIGGGSFSGKDPTKVDRSGAYLARYLAKNLVAARFTDRCQIQIAYAIGVVEPVSFRITLDPNHHDIDLERLERWIRAEVDCTPRGIIDRFRLQRPIYTATATGGHFGNPDYPWEQLDLALKLIEACDRGFVHQGLAT